MRPAEEHWPVTNPYGRPGDYAAGYHTGVDYGTPTGARARSPRRGRVIQAGVDPAYGKHVLVRGWLRRKAYLLAHLDKIEVREGQRVKRGQTVGRTGNTGNSRGPHLHAEQRHRPFGYWDHERPTAFSASR